MNTTFSTLVDASTVAARLADPAWRIVDCRFDLADPAAGRRAWQAGHIPGAIYADLDQDLAAPAVATAGGRHPLPKPDVLAATFGAWGIDSATQVVAYDAAGGAVAGRLWWLLRWMGHESVAVLDGGWSAWIGAGLPVDDRAATARPVRFKGQPGHMPVVDAAAVTRGLADNSLLLLDARAAERFQGDVEPLDRVAGHVPGAVNQPLTGNLDADQCFRPAAALQTQYRALLGGRSPASVVCMCGSGVTACHNLLAMEVAGLPGAALYSGSWSDWISDPDRPVARS